MDIRSLKFSIFVFFFFLDILWFVWWFWETWRLITGGGGVDMQSMKFSLLVFFFFQNIWGNFEMDNMRKRIGYAIPEFFLCFILFPKNSLVHLVV